jgi:heptosyltransferase-2
MKIIVRAPNWVGDCVMALPLLQLLREQHPYARIVVLAKKPGLELFAGNPHIDEAWPYQGLWATAARLRAGRFDLGILTPNSISAAVLFAVGGVRRRVGYATEGRGLLLTRRLPWKGETEHRSLRYARLAQPDLKPGDLTPAGYPARIVVDAKAKALADQLLAGIAADRLVAINPCANALSRRWPAERFAELARLLAAGGATVLLVGGPAIEDRARVAEVRSGCRSPRVHDLSGRTTLPGLAAVLSRVRALITGDTGIMHVGAAAGAPIVALEGAADVAVTAPWTTGHFTAIDKHVSCSPCVKNVCINRATPMICMTSIEPAEVARAAAPLISA